MISRLFAAVVASVLLVPATVLDQAYPSRPIRFIVPNSPGGGTDILSRTLATDGVEIQAGLPERFSSFIVAEREKRAKAVKESGAKVD